MDARDRQQRARSNNPEAQSYASDVFDSLDADRSGYLDENEFGIAMTNLGFAGSRADANAVFYAVGSNGRISKKDFVDYWVANHN